jgi:hypothetical protein
LSRVTPKDAAYSKKKKKKKKFKKINPKNKIEKIMGWLGHPILAFGGGFSHP